MPNPHESPDPTPEVLEQPKSVMQPVDIPLEEQAGLYIRLKVLEELEAIEQDAPPLKSQKR